MDDTKRIHDIAIALLPKALETLDIPLYNDSGLNSEEIVGAYKTLCSELSEEFEE